ncbi:hypothetical protein RMCN_4538 [Mycolicibacterium novocastrense]|uniref:Uncharacterized protein n=1 Tax=Mycolicibacterium novocastrense TaxID=59813 RepID=A0ABQ0KP59_MYCNV|nr:hypothetical protein RMCN_4538 [Mycolicibacterium novocastrense]
MTSLLGMRLVIVQPWITAPSTNLPWDPSVWVWTVGPGGVASGSAEANGAAMNPAVAVAAKTLVILVIFKMCS